jgi:nucleoside-diphosphate-sugar epimerase
VREAVVRNRVIFNLAGEISHLTSMSDPQRDLSINASAQLSLLDVIRLHNPAATVVYASSRQVYGSARYLPVDELHPISPVDYNGVHKLTAEGYHSLLRHQFGVNAICLRLGNVYGPRQGIHQDGRGFIDTFLRMVLKGEQLRVFGDGRQMRGMLYVDDAVEAFLRAAAAGACASAVYNIGHPVPVSLIDVARQLAAFCCVPEPIQVPFPCDRKAIDIGDFFQNTERARSELGWMPQVSFADGLRKTFEFFEPRIAERLHAGTPEVG